MTNVVVAVFVGLAIVAAVGAMVVREANGRHTAGGGQPTGPNAKVSASPSPADAPESVLKLVRRFMYDQTEVPGDLTAKCGGWMRDEVKQDLTCQVTYEGQQIDLELAFDVMLGMVDKHEQTKTFLSAEAVRKAFQRNYGDRKDLRDPQCDDAMPANAVVDYNMPLPYTCAYREQSGSTRRFKVSIEALGITFR